MLFPLLLAWSLQLPDFNAMAKSRDVDAILRHCAPGITAKNFQFLKQRGAYDVGRFGWGAETGVDPVTGKTYVVFTTPLTSQDIGEQVYELAGAKLAKEVPETADGGIKIKSHAFDIRFNLGQKRVEIVDAMTIQRASTAGPSFMFRMGSQYKVASIQDEVGKPVPFSQAAGCVFVKSPSAGTATYKLAYGGVVNLPGYAGSINAKEVLLANDYWYPMIARHPAKHSLKVQVPGDWTVVAMGEREASVPRDGLKTVSYRMDVPAVFFSLSAGKYESRKDRLGNLDFYVVDAELTDAERAMQNRYNRDVIDFYSRTFGKYPFSSWTTMITPIYGGGALEAYSYATYGSGWMPDEDSHEPAHTWWGGLLQNTYLNSFWNESFAVYSGMLYNRLRPVGDTQDRKAAFLPRMQPQGGFGAAPLARSGASIGPPAVSLGYGKGALVLAMLEHVIGPDEMIASMREFLNKPPGTAVNWEDFEAAVAKATGKEYKWFFDQWLRRTDYPDLVIDQMRFASGAVFAKVGFKGQGFRLKLDYVAEFADGTRDSGFVMVGPDPETVKIPLKRKPVKIAFDPWQRLLRRYDASENRLGLGVLQRAKRYQDPAHKDWWASMRSRNTLDTLPSDLNEVLLVGSPETLPAMAPLCKQAGFTVKGNKLTFRGTTIDLTKQCAAAVIKTPKGWTAIALGKGVERLDGGMAWAAIFDEQGRFLRGSTEPRMEGYLAYRL